jgi:flavodoxin
MLLYKIYKIHFQYILYKYNNLGTLADNHKILIAYFSWSENTRKIAKQIYQFVGGDIFEIQRAEKYPVSYSAVLNIAKKEIRNADKPELKNKPVTIDEYDTIFIGYPNWWNTFPAPVLSFLSEFDFSGKTIIPFCTHGGGGIGKSVYHIEKQCPKAEVLNAFAINLNAVRNNNAEVENWLKMALKSSISENGK